MITCVIRNQKVKAAKYSATLLKSVSVNRDDFDGALNLCPKNYRFFVKIAICNPFRKQNLWISLENMAVITVYSRLNIVEFNYLKSASEAPFLFKTIVQGRVPKIANWKEEYCG